MKRFSDESSPDEYSDYRQQRFKRLSSGSDSEKEKPLSSSFWPVQPFSKFCGKFPYFRQPSEIGTFSHDENHQFVHDSSALKCYCPPPNERDLEFDLTIGYDNCIEKDEDQKEYLDDLLKWVQLNRDKFKLVGQPQTNSLNTDFMCWRGLLTKLICTPYENREGWKISVMRHNGTYFMCEYETEQHLQDRIRRTDRQKEMCYWGFKFEQYVTAKPGSLPDTDSPVNNLQDFCSVVRARLNTHSLAFGGETDCYEEVGNRKSYVELKTSREMFQPNQERNFKRFKLLKWWAQSFLVGVPKIVCGFRDDEGTVVRLQSFQTLDIPKMTKDMPNCWDPAVCFNFCDRFLQTVKDTIVKDDPRKAYVFTWEPNEPVRWLEYPHDSEYAFLPEWFYNTPDGGGDEKES